MSRSQRCGPATSIFASTGLLAAGWDGHVIGRAAGLLACGVENRSLYRDVRFLCALVLDLGADDHGGFGVRDGGRRDVGAPLRHAYGSGHVEPHIPIDAGPGIPA